MRLAILALVALMTACGNRLENGEIVEKRYEPEKTDIVLLPMTISCGQSCFNTMMIPYRIFDDEDFVVVVTGFNEDGESVTEDWYVTKAFYESREVGEMVWYSDDVAELDDEHEKLGRAG